MSEALHHRVMMAAVLIGAIAAVAVGQDVPYVGIVIEPTVKVRAGAAKTMYSVAELERGSLVKVDEVMFGWYKIEPPSAFFSYISKAYVDAKEGGQVGVVNTDYTVVKAGGTDRPADQCFRIQLRLRKDDTVDIIGESGSFYKIRPPSGVFVFLPPSALRRASSKEIAAGGLVGEPAEASVPPEVPEKPEIPELEPLVDLKIEAPVAPVAPEAPRTDPAQANASIESVPPLSPAAKSGGAQVLPTADSQSLKILDEQFEQSQKLLLEEQPIDTLLVGYRKLANDPKLSPLDRRAVDLRIAHLNRNQVLAAMLLKIDQIEKQIETTTATPKLVPADGAQYVAVGRLLASMVYNGQTLPRLYRLVEPSDQRTLAYLRPGGDLESTALGRLVGVVGEAKYDPSLKLKLIEVETIDLLEPRESPSPSPSPETAGEPEK